MLGGQQQVTRPLPAGRPIEVGVIAFTLPPAAEAAQLQLHVHFASDGAAHAVQCDNEWPLWSYPQPADWNAHVAVYDPTYALADLPELAAARGPLATAGGRVVIAGGLDQALRDFVQDGGHVLLLQQQEGVLPVRRGPFWREAVKLICPHPLWARFPQAGFADLQFFGLATDVMVDTEKLADILPQITGFTPILRRLDAREFTVTDYLCEAGVGKGKLLICTLRLQGGAGVQPTGLRRNVAGWSLLAAMIEYLANPTPYGIVTSATG